MLKAIDAGLLCTVVIIVSLGLYELFVSRINEAHNKPLGTALEVGNIDGLKDKLGKAILLAYAGGVALLMALFLSRHQPGKPEPKKEERIGD